MIVVATEDFELYHELLAELRNRDVSFTTIEPGDRIPEEAAVLVTGAGDDVDAALETVVADADDARKAVDEALAVLRGGTGRTIVGVDPGPNPGVAVLSGDLVVAAFRVPVEDTVDVVLDEIEGALDPLVRVGDGARLHGARVVDGLADAGVTVELVDETGTTPHLGAGVRGMDDVLAAANIARLEGEVVTSRSFEPTAGELQVIKSRSRERSAENRAIPESLARRVARGELTLDEAIEEHGE
ncbi:hypothetical protein [Salarchaeum sp. JOR-1]|uniref:hypothetical protein n=1 Tax=Salarchaeum sp. JOR-1 TaxID=2599399 RepID=UPI0011985023|nr:hypothetical protein [Salarchaeum sp. JOR-1]QDX40588.1 hypothetical protein FQU85_06615 [Salarchaeum sp. JOR-1]